MNLVAFSIGATLLTIFTADCIRHRYKKKRLDRSVKMAYDHYLKIKNPPKHPEVFEDKAHIPRRSIWWY